MGANFGLGVRVPVREDLWVALGQLESLRDVVERVAGCTYFADDGPIVDGRAPMESAASSSSSPSGPGGTGGSFEIRAESAERYKSDMDELVIWLADRLDCKDRARSSFRVRSKDELEADARD